MTRIFCIGTGPLLDAEVRVFSGQSLRTLQYVQPLRDAGHEVELFTCPIPGADEPEGQGALATPAEIDGWRYRRLRANDENTIVPHLQEAHDRFRPDAVLGVNPYPAHLACRLLSDAPTWCDLNGYSLAEGQARAAVYGDDECLAHFRRHECSVLRRADKFSVASRRQQYAVLGELALMGRLGRLTFDYDFACFIPEAVADHYRALGAQERRGDDATFRILWCGGFNSWTDVDLLFDVLTRAMDKRPEVEFIATGGAVVGHDEKTYQRFRELVRGSRHFSRFSLLNWVESRVVDDLLLRCDLGINIDGKNHESIFGARHRITTMLACGLPVLTTLGAEICEDIHQRNLGLFAEVGDADRLLEAIVFAASRHDQLRNIARRGREYALKAFDPARTVADCLEWMAAPRHAPDNALRRAEGDPAVPWQWRALNDIEVETAALDRFGLDQLLQARAELKRIRGRLFFKTVKMLKSKIRGGQTHGRHK